LSRYLPALFFFFPVILVLPMVAQGQRLTVTGTVYDITKKTPVEAVTVQSTGGAGTITDSLGNYSIVVHEKDSIYFSYQNKPTPKFPVSGIANTAGFDISILKKVAELPNVFVKQRNYRFDSLQNRQDYAKIFDYRKPGVRSSMAPGSGAGVGIDMVELINMFRFRRNRSMLAFQNRLLKEEEDKFIDHRFSKALVRKLTRLSSPELEKFMKVYRPTLDMVKSMNDLEFGQFIVDAYEYYSIGKRKGYAGEQESRTDQ
jgi:hypothetical protein